MWLPQSTQSAAAVAALEHAFAIASVIAASSCCAGLTCLLKDMLTWVHHVAVAVMQFPRPEYVAADLSKVKLADALATTSFNPKEPALFTIGESQ